MLHEEISALAQKEGSFLIVEGTFQVAGKGGRTWTDACLVTVLGPLHLSSETNIHKVRSMLIVPFLRQERSVSTFGIVYTMMGLIKKQKGGMSARP